MVMLNFMEYACDEPSGSGRSCEPAPSTRSRDVRRSLTVRLDKVLAVRRALQDHTYDEASKLSAAIDRLQADL